MLRYKINYFLLILTAVILSGSLTLLFSEDPNITDADPDTTSGHDGTEGPDVITLDQYNPVAVNDPRFKIHNITVERRYAGNGMGEVLDVVFEIHNRKREPVELIGWVIATKETNAVNENSRNLVPYPTWRTHDPLKEVFLVHNVHISPKQIPAEKIWSEKDKDYQIAQMQINRWRNAVATTEPIDDPYPPIWKYVAYISRYPTQGLAFTLPGVTSPTEDKAVQSDYIPMTAEERKNRVHKTLDQHTYTLEHMSRKTVYRTHHYEYYRDDMDFFNRVSILVFDAEKAKQYEEQAGRQLNDGEERINPMVYYRTFTIDRKLKIH